MRRRLEHTEWQLKWYRDLPVRVFEYHVLIALAIAAETPGKRPPPIRSTVVLLSGREEPWPLQSEYRTSPNGEPFTGVVFRIDAVYQRTVAELEARASPFWLMFTPLAVDADADGMRRIVTKLRRGADRREHEELAVAMTVMADADKRRRNLRNAILPLLDEELVMQSWVYKQGEARGEARGRTIGKAEGEASALLRVLQSRGLSVPDTVRERILGCTDTAQLEAWLDRALVAGRVEDVLDDA